MENNIEFINILYVDDSTSLHFVKGIDEISFLRNQREIKFNCGRFDYATKSSSKELGRLLKTLREKDFHAIFIDSCLFQDNDVNQMFGIWLAYYIKKAFPLIHICLVSSKINGDQSYAQTSFPFLEKIPNQSDKHYEEIVNGYCIYLENVEKDIENMQKSLELFNTNKSLLEPNLENAIELTIKSMKAPDTIQPESFKEIISLIQKLIIQNE